MRFENGKLVYRKGLRTREVKGEDLVWGYLQIEEATAGMCCGSYTSFIGRAVFLDRQGEKHIFQSEGTEKAESLLKTVSEACPTMAVGFTEENKQRFAEFRK